MRKVPFSEYIYFTASWLFYSVATTFQPETEVRYLVQLQLSYVFRPYSICLIAIPAVHHRKCGRQRWKEFRPVQKIWDTRFPYPQVLPERPEWTCRVPRWTVRSGPRQIPEWKMWSSKKSWWRFERTGELGFYKLCRLVWCYSFREFGITKKYTLCALLICIAWELP